MFVIKHSIYLLREPIDCFGVQVNLSLICSSPIFPCSSNVIVTISTQADDTCIRDHNNIHFKFTEESASTRSNDLNHLHPVKTKCC